MLVNNCRTGISEPRHQAELDKLLWEKRPGGYVRRTAEQVARKALEKNMDLYDTDRPARYVTLGAFAFPLLILWLTATGCLSSVAATPSVDEPPLADTTPNQPAEPVGCQCATGGECDCASCECPDCGCKVCLGKPLDTASLDVEPSRPTETPARRDETGRNPRLLYFGPSEDFERYSVPILEQHNYTFGTDPENVIQAMPESSWDEFGVKASPTFLRLENGRVTHRLVGRSDWKSVVNAVHGKQMFHTQYSPQKKVSPPENSVQWFYQSSVHPYYSQSVCVDGH